MVVKLEGCLLQSLCCCVRQVYVVTDTKLSVAGVVHLSNSVFTWNAY